MTAKEMQKYVVENIFQYLPKGKKWEVKASTNYQNNDRKICTVSISCDGAVFKTIGVDMLCDLYNRGMDLEEIMNLFANFIVMELPNELNDFAKNVFDFDFIKNRIFATVVHYACNINRLQNLVYKKEEDLAFTYKILVENSDDNLATIPIQNNLLQHWNITIDELHDLAIENTKQIMPVRAYSLQEMTIKMLLGIFQISNSDDYFDMADVDWTEDVMYVITNKLHQYGAFYMFDKDLLSEIAEKMKTNHLYVFPSSVHETIICNAEAIDPNDANQLVVDANIRACSDDEVLSDHAYIFDLESQELVSL
jgi:hypothetical protein